MPVQIAWDNDDHLLVIIRFISPWTADELMHELDDGIRMFSSVSHLVDFIVDYHEASAQIPTQYLPVVRQIKSIGRMNRGVMVVVGAPYFIQSLTKFAREIAPAAYENLYFARDLKAARMIIEKHTHNRT